MKFDKMLKILNIHILLLLFYSVHVAFSEKYTFCVNTNGIEDLCDQLKSLDVICVHTDDSVNKALKLMTRECELARFTAEELLLVNDRLKNKVVILSEIRDIERKDDEFDFETVVVKRKNPSGTFTTYRGNKMCHPGLESDRRTVRQSTEFDRHLISQYVLKNRTYDKSLSMTENFFAALDSYLGPSCYRGQWLKNAKHDSDLKNKYKNLIELCPEKQNETYNPLDCLTEKKGDISYFDLSLCKKYFNSHSATVNIADYQLVCPDGTLQDINANRKCSWISQPWPAIVSVKDKQFPIQDDLISWKKDPNKWKLNPLRKALNISDKNYLFLYTTPREITEYVGLAGNTPPLNFSNDMQIKWCVSKEYEDEKCDWLSRASDKIGIIPRLGCIKKKTLSDCIRSVDEKESDLINIESDFGYLTERIDELEAIGFEKTKEKVSVLLMKNKNSKINSINKLNEANICFPIYNGLAWISLQSDINIVDGTMSPTFKEVCAPGANSESLGGSSNTELCNLCLDKQCSIVNNPYYGNNGALMCLLKADFAAIIKESVNITVDSNFDIMCKNNSIVHKTDLDVDEDCALLVTYKKHFVTRKNEEKNIDIEQYLRRVRQYFGENSSFDTIRLTGNIHGHKNVLFEDSTEDILFPDRYDRYVTNYNDLFKEDTPGTNTYNGLSYGYYILIIVAVFITIGILIFMVYFLTVVKGYKRAGTFAP